MKNLLFVLFCLIPLLTNCSFFSNKEPTPQFTTGAFIVQHDPTQSTISYFDTIAKRVVNNVYYQQNKQMLAAGAQSMNMHNGRGYIVLSNQIKVVNASTLQELGTISDGLENCRYFVGVDASTAYVTCGGSTTNPFVAVIDLNTLQVTDTIKVDSQPEKIVVVTSTGPAFVANSGGSTLSIINTQSNTVINSIKVGDYPSGMVFDKNNKLWVLCSGKPAIGTDLGTYPYLYRINPSSPTTNTVRFQVGILKGTNPANLAINAAKDRLYFTLGKAIYSFPTASADTTKVDVTTQIIPHSFSRMNIDPNTDELYGYDITSKFVSRYKLPNAAKLDSFTIVYAPSGFSFQPPR